MRKDSERLSLLHTLCVVCVAVVCAHALRGRLRGPKRSATVRQLFLVRSTLGGIRVGDAALTLGGDL